MRYSVLIFLFLITSCGVMRNKNTQILVDKDTLEVENDPCEGGRDYHRFPVNIREAMHYQDVAPAVRQSIAKSAPKWDLNPAEEKSSKSDVIVSDEAYEPIMSKSDGLKLIKKKNTNLRDDDSDIKIGHVVYQTPDTMIVMVESKVIVRISRGSNVKKTSDGLFGLANVVNINVTDKMEVKLVDPSPDANPSFNIKSVNKSEQEVYGETYTQWEFTVVPLRSGKHELKLLVSIIRDGRSKDQVWSDTIQVKNNIPREVLNFWEKYWQYLLSTFIIPIFLFLWRRKKNDNKKLDGDGSE